MIGLGTATVITVGEMVVYSIPDITTNPIGIGTKPGVDIPEKLE